MNLMGASVDTAVINRGIRAKCNAKPAKPASMVRAEAYEAKAADVEKAGAGVAGQRHAQWPRASA